MNPSVPSRSVAVAARRAAATGHLSAVAVAGLVVVVAGRPLIWAGMVAFLGPLAVLLTLGRRDRFVHRHAREALWFNLSVALYLAVVVAGLLAVPVSPYTIQLAPFLIFLNLLIAFNWLVFTGIAAYRAARGLLITYPLTIRWVADRRAGGDGVVNRRRG
jgi:uncharacterized Tic20 family protein